MLDAPSSRFVRLTRTIDTFSRFTGRFVAWLTLAMMAVTCLVMVLRYGFEIGSILLQESVAYMHATVFLLGAAFCLQRDGHVRVDIFYRNLSPRHQAWVNSLGSILFLIPFSVFLFAISWDFVASSWEVHETSMQADGIPAVFLLKSLIPLFALTLALQGVADLLRSLAVLMEAEEVLHE